MLYICIHKSQHKMTMRNKYVLLIAVLLFVSTTGLAQRRTVRLPIRLNRTDTSRIVRNYLDSMNIYRAKYDSLARVNAELQQSLDGRYYRLFAPATFYHSAANQQLSLNPDGTDEVANAVDAVLMNIYLRRPDLIRSSENQLETVGGILEDLNVQQTQNTQITQLTGNTQPSTITPETTPPDDTPDVVLITKPNFWEFKGDYYLQFLQNFISGNWHKGGESNYAMLGSITLEANYNNKQKLKWDNKLEMKLGFQTSRSDTVHKFKSNNDILRLTSKLGLQAHNKWYYTLKLLAYTQFTRGLKSNDEFIYSDFFSPFDLNIALGMDYSVEAFDKKLTGNVNISPFSYNFRYVGRLGLATRFGLEEGKHALHDFGSSVSADLTWKFSDQMTWKTRLYAFTSYKRALIEWENTLELKISRFITTNLYIYPRFDDSGARDSDLGYLQFMEYCSLGFSYSF